MPLAFVLLLGGSELGSRYLCGKYFIDGAISIAQSCLFSHLLSILAIPPTTHETPWLQCDPGGWLFLTIDVLVFLVTHKGLQELNAWPRHGGSILCHLP